MIETTEEFALPPRPSSAAPISAPDDVLAPECSSFVAAAASLPINDIIVHAGRRPVDEQRVARLAESMQEIGLRTPVSVWNSGNGYELVAGAHRLAAAKALGWEKIEVAVVDLDEIGRQLWKIDENLMRSELTPAQHAECMARRKQLYLERHPETANGGDRGNQYTGGKMQSDNLSFCQDTAEKTGMNRRTIERSVHRAEAIPDIGEVVGTSLDKGVELDALAKLPSEEQRKLIDEAKIGNPVSARAKAGAELQRRLDAMPRIPSPGEVDAMAAAEREAFVASIGTWLAGRLEGWEIIKLVRLSGPLLGEALQAADRCRESVPQRPGPQIDADDDEAAQPRDADYLADILMARLPAEMLVELLALDQQDRRRLDVVLAERLRAIRERAA